MLDSQCQPGLASPAVVAAGSGRGKSELMDINGCGFDGEGSGGGGEGGEKERETDGKDEKAEKITHEAKPLADERMDGFRLMSGRS